MKKILFNEDGSSVVEVAVMMPILLMLIFGSIAIIQAQRTQVVLDMAAREAAREFSVTHSKSKAINKAEDELELGGIDPDKTTITAREKGYERQVYIEMEYPFMIPWAGELKPTLRGSASFHREVKTTYW